MDLNNEVEITAHRGSSITAPENSLSAIRQAIEDGADYAEIDVQETRDGTIVLFHDTDLLRVYGIKKNIWEVDYSEIAGLDSGSWFSTDFASERIATLQQAIETARGRIRLNIELKFNPYSKRLAEQVLDILEQENFSDQVLVTSLDLSGLQRLRALNPDVRVGYIVFRAIGNLMRLDVDALSVSAAIAEPWFVTHAHRSGKEVHVWTVNERADMQRFVDYGVDNIITDHPALLRDVLRDRSEMSREARLLIRARHWF
jgi:glycerophosphoryl diester phosphodiesterase